MDMSQWNSWFERLFLGECAFEKNQNQIRQTNQTFVDVFHLLLSVYCYRMQTIGGFYKIKDKPDYDADCKYRDVNGDATVTRDCHLRQKYQEQRETKELQIQHQAPASYQAQFNVLTSP